MWTYYILSTTQIYLGLGTSGKTTTVATLPIQKSLENSDRKDANHRTHRTILFDCRSEAQSSSNENSSDKKRIFLDEMVIKSAILHFRHPIRL